MILNKSAVERGLAHGTLFKTEQLDLKDDKGKSQVCVPTCPHMPAHANTCLRQGHGSPAGKHEIV